MTRVADALGRFLIQLEADGRSPHTIGQYRRHVGAFMAWLASEGLPDGVASIDHETVACFLAAPAARERMGGGLKCPVSMNSMRTSLRVFFRYLHEAGTIAFNPARLVRRALCGVPPPRTLSPEERAKLMAAMAADPSPQGRRDHVLFGLMLGSGIRVGSAVGVRVEDLDLQRGQVHVRTAKGSRPEVVFVPPDVVQSLRQFAGDRQSGPLFEGRPGVHITTRHVHRRFCEWLAKAGVTRRASPHALRHTFATDLLARTGDVALVQAALRHRSITSTLVYARVDESKVRRAIGG